MYEKNEMKEQEEQGCNEMKEQGWNVEQGSNELNALRCQNELLSGMEKFALKVGKEYIETKYVLADYTLDFRQSEVFRRNDNDKIDLNNPYFTFEEWIESLSPSSFSQQLMFDLFEAGIGSFNDFINYVKDALKEKYNLKLTEAKDKVAKLRKKE